MEIAIDTTTEKEFCGDNRNNRNRFNYLDTKYKNFSNMLNGLKEDRLIKYFGSDGLLHLLKNIHNKISKINFYEATLYLDEPIKFSYFFDLKVFLQRHAPYVRPVNPLRGLYLLFVQKF